MEPFTINLNQMAEKGGRYKRYLIITSIIFVALSATSFGILYSKQNPWEWYFLLIAFYAIFFIYFVITGYKAKLFLSGDDFAIEYQFSFFMKTPNKIILETINRVKVGPTYVAFYKRSGRRKVITLGWLPYSKVVDIKGKITNLCEAKGIEVQVVEYQRG